MPRFNGMRAMMPTLDCRGEREDVLARFLGEQIVFHLDSFGAAVLDGGDAFFHGIDRNAVVADFAGLLGALKHMPNFAALDHVNGRIMQLVEIDVVGLQSLQALVHDAADVIGIKDPLAAVGSDHHVAALGGEDDFIAFSFQRVPQQCFRIARAVRIRGVDKIDA